MTICTITCHDVYNAGASLQAFALCSFLNQQGHSTYIIDYKPHYLSQQYILWGNVSPKYDKPIYRLLYQLAKLPIRLLRRLGKRKKAYDNFRAKYLPLSKKKYRSIEDLQASPPVADVYFAGSDQIWNTLFPNGKDPAFYLTFVSDSKIKASYAASFATNSISTDCKNNVKNWLHNLDFISVRESSGLNILSELGIQYGTQVLDPVFLLSKDQWQAIEEPFKIKSPYILLYDFDKSEDVKEFVIRKAKLNGWKIYSILPCEYADSVFSHCGPTILPTLIHYASLIVSNSFHATAFSLIYEKNFIVFDRSEEINSRMQDLLNLIGGEAKQEHRDYSVIRPRIQSALNNSTKFISTVLLEAEERRKQ